jgi:hypothetical protein
VEEERHLCLRQEAELQAANPLDPRLAWEEAQWSPWPESPTRSSHNNASPPGGVIDAHAQEDDDEVNWD